MFFRDLSSSNIALVPLSELTLEALHSWSVMPEFFQAMQFGPSKNISESATYLEKLKTRSDGQTGHYWALKIIGGGIIGTFGVLEINERKGMAEIGYGIHPKFWGKGYFRETLELIIPHLMDEMKFHRLWAKTQFDNHSSIRALEAYGFKREGVLKDFYLSYVDGKRSDAVILAIIAGQG
jgi:ribosomal-protein-alanine N-acetyltransferase